MKYFNELDIMVADDGWNEPRPLLNISSDPASQRGHWRDGCLACIAMMESTDTFEFTPKESKLLQETKGMTRQDSAIDAQMDLEPAVRAIIHCKWIPQPQKPDLLQLAVRQVMKMMISESCSLRLS